MTGVCNMEGAELDAAVARAQGWVVDGEAVDYGYTRWRTKEGAILCFGYFPSDRWEQAGPIIENSRIQLEPLIASIGDWHAIVTSGAVGRAFGIGPTPLIAAMRAFVASRDGG